MESWSSDHTGQIHPFGAFRINERTSIIFGIIGAYSRTSSVQGQAEPAFTSTPRTQTTTKPAGGELSSLLTEAPMLSVL